MSADFRATYRVQLHGGFAFDDAAALAGYLEALGVSHLYCSPYLQSAPGSTHGYDIVDYSRVNQELGGPEGHARLCAALARHHLGQVLDIVPNHMAINVAANRWWWDVLENGPSSLYAAYFDVDWDPPEQRLPNAVLLPVLEDHYGRVLEAGRIKLTFDGAAFVVLYRQLRFPVAPRSLDTLLEQAARRSHSDALGFLADAYAELPLPTATDVASVRKRHRDKEVLRAQLTELCRQTPAVRAAIDHVVASLNRNIEALHALLERQNYRLAYWRSAARDLGYRRFFDINSLAGLRAENEEVFQKTHALILKWLASGVLDGVRVDHPDGLRDPLQYLERLRAAAPRAWIVVEKILEPQERLPANWPIAGTTGYDFLNRVAGLFLDPGGEQPLSEFYAEFCGERVDYAALVRDKKLQIMRELLGSDIHRLTGLLLDTCESHPRYRDYTRDDLREAIEAVAAEFPVYRTYVQAVSGRVSETDAAYIATAVSAAKSARPELDPRLLDFLGDILSLRVRGGGETEWVMRFQQLTAPAMAKGVEDTAFYVYNRLIGLNEVGGDPGHFGLSVAAFHHACIETHRCWPRTMVSTATHDTKRGEDVRTRLALLSEIPGRWADAVRHWSEHNQRYKQDGWPEPNFEYLIYQTLVGAWPLSPDRLLAYATKASREAKVHTSWNRPNPVYDIALRNFLNGIATDEEFQAMLAAFVQTLRPPGWINSLAQTLLKLTCPGVPDIYQGGELWDLSLVDPDNRRPIDFALRQHFLQELDGLSVAQIWERLEDGLPKLWLIRETLALRRRRPACFDATGAYHPLNVAGTRAGHAVAFLRGESVAVVVPRLVLGLGGDWDDTAVEVPSGTWHNRLSGERVAGGWMALAPLLEPFPLALLEREGAGR